MRIVLTTIIFLLFSCDSIKENTASLKEDTARAFSNVLIESNTDSVFFKEGINIESKAYMSILPGDKWIDSMQQINGEEGWNEVVADNEHYRNQTEIYLTSKGYIEIAKPNGKMWYFIRPNNFLKTIDSDTLTNKLGTIIFNRNNDPVFYDGTEPEIDLDTL
jgi:hypothetical protein